MSGGHFNYQQHSMQDIISELKTLIKNNNIPNDYGYCRNYSDKTILKFKEAIGLLKKAHDLVYHIDYLVSGDDGEDTFWEQVK